MLEILSTIVAAWLNVASKLEPNLQVSTNQNQAEILVEANTITRIPAGAQRVAMLQLTINASCKQDVTIESLTFKRTGLGLNSDLTGVYLLDDSLRISRSQQIQNKDSQVTLRPRNTLTIAACNTKKLTLAADFSSTAKGEHQFELLSTIPSLLQVDTLNQANEANELRVISQNEGGLTIKHITVPSVRYGASKTVGRFSLTSTSNQDQQIHHIQLTNNGSARNSDLQNISLYLRNGTQVSATLAQLDDDVALLKLEPPFVLSNKSSINFDVIADVRASISKTIQLEIEEPSDIDASVDESR